MTAPDRVTLDMHEHAETEGERAAWRLSLDGINAHARWIPKSLVEKLADGRFSIDRWKAQQEGFLELKNQHQGKLDL